MHITISYATCNHGCLANGIDYACHTIVIIGRCRYVAIVMLLLLPRFHYFTWRMGSDVVNRVAPHIVRFYFTCGVTRIFVSFPFISVSVITDMRIDWLARDGQRFYIPPACFRKQVNIKMYRCLAYDDIIEILLRFLRILSALSMACELVISIICRKVIICLNGDTFITTPWHYSRDFAEIRRTTRRRACRCQGLSLR